MPRVLFLTQTHNVWGGMEQWLHNFTFWLQRETEWDVRVGVVRGARFNDARAYVAAHPHIRPVVLDVRAGTESSRIAAVRRAIDDVAPDLVVPIASGAVFPAMAGHKRARLLVPVRSQHADLFVNIADYFPIVDGVVAVNRLMQRWLDEHLRERIHYVRHGVKPAAMIRVPEPLQPLRVGFVGRLDPVVKRVLDLIPVVNGVESDISMHVYGDGPAEGELRAALGGRVEFHGYASQERLYAEAYPKLDVVLLFSSEEGTPNVICEAMQHGVVPVTSRYRGQAGERFVIDGVTGFTFEVGDAAGAARHLDAVARDRELLAQLSRAARENVRDDTDVRMHRDWLAIFESTLALPMKNGAVPQPASGPAGRLDRIFGTSIADKARVLLHRGAAHQDGWGEWPGTMPVDPARAAAVVRELEEIDRSILARD
jgi:glycosyltransferase involved in cell wall biosynthesis